MKITVTKLDIVGVETIYGEQIYIEDSNHPEGGSMQTVTKFYPTPRIRVNLWADVEGQELQVNATYIDYNEVAYRAMEPGKIVLESEVVEKFSLPTSLTLVSAPFAEGSQKQSDVQSTK